MAYRDLRDAEGSVNAHTAALIAQASSMSTYFLARVTAERAFAKHVSEGAATARGKALGAGRTVSTLDQAYLRFLEGEDLKGRTHLAFAENLQRVADLLVQAAAAKEATRKKHHHFAAKLADERNRSATQRDKSRKAYWDAASAVEAARSKKALATDERQRDKATRTFDLATNEMAIAKNQYLLDIDASNAAKAVYYDTSLPGLHADLQLLETSVVSQLEHLLRQFTTLERESLGTLQGIVEQKDAALGTIDTPQDQQAFVTANSANLSAFEVPPDAVFEPCPIWADTPDMSTTADSVVFLQNVKIKAEKRLGEISPVVDSKRREISGLRDLVVAYEKNRTLGDAGVVLENLLESIREATLLELTATELQAQIDLVSTSLPDDAVGPSRPHNFKPSSFVTPTTCEVCQGTLWGKALLCKECGCSVHKTCELQMAATCGSPLLQRSKSRREGKLSGLPSRRSLLPSLSTTSSASSSIAPHASVSPTSTLGSASSFSHSPIVPRAAAPPALSSPATMLYSYAATTAFEISVPEGADVEVIEPEDASGWVKVRSADERVGLVPGSYLRMGEAGADDATGEGTSHLAGHHVVAMYEYVAQGMEELSLVEGESVELTDVGADFGEGWTEVSKDGKVGIVPSSYVQPA